VRYQEVRVAGTPSNYPNFLVFPKKWTIGDRKVFTLPGQSVLGLYSFASEEVVDVTATGRKYAGGPDIWLQENAVHLPEIWEPCERRILRLPVGVTEADTALERHLEEILRRVILHGQDRGELQVAAATAPTLVGSGRLPGPGYVPETPLTGSGARKGGGGNAPSPYGDCGWTTGGRNVARQWAAKR
jgi:hypothetical protein